MFNDIYYEIHGWIVLFYHAKVSMFRNAGKSVGATLVSVPSKVVNVALLMSAACTVPGKPELSNTLPRPYTFVPVIRVRGVVSMGDSGGKSPAYWSDSTAVMNMLAVHGRGWDSEPCAH